MDDFANKLKAHQPAWLLANGHQGHWFEGPRPWVLHDEHRARNLYRPDWWRLLGNRPHRWARSLQSSQCFAVNLFAPLTEDEGLARRVLRGCESSDSSL